MVARGCSAEGLLDAGAFFGSIAQRLQVRFYSISSSPLMHPQSIHVTCAVVHEKTVTGTFPSHSLQHDPAKQLEQPMKWYCEQKFAFVHFLKSQNAL